MWVDIVCGQLAGGAGGRADLLPTFSAVKVVCGLEPENTNLLLQLTWQLVLTKSAAGQAGAGAGQRKMGETNSILTPREVTADFKAALAQMTSYNEKWLQSEEYQQVQKMEMPVELDDSDDEVEDMNGSPSPGRAGTRNQGETPHDEQTLSEEEDEFLSKQEKAKLKAKEDLAKSERYQQGEKMYPQSKSASGNRARMVAGDDTNYGRSGGPTTGGQKRMSDYGEDFSDEDDVSGNENRFKPNAQALQLYPRSRARTGSSVRLVTSAPFEDEVVEAAGEEEKGVAADAAAAEIEPGSGENRDGEEQEEGGRELLEDGGRTGAADAEGPVADEERLEHGEEGGEMAAERAAAEEPAPAPEEGADSGPVDAGEDDPGAEGAEAAEDGEKAASPLLEAKKILQELQTGLANYFPFLANALPNSLKQKGSEAGVVCLFQLLLNGVGAEGIEAGAIEDPGADISSLAEDLADKLPHDWIFHVVTESASELLDRYGFEDLVETLQGLLTYDGPGTERLPVPEGVLEGAPVTMEQRVYAAFPVALGEGSGESHLDVLFAEEEGKEKYVSDINHAELTRFSNTAASILRGF
eukprot:g12749.t1